MRWPWQPRPARREAEHSEEQAQRVEAEVIIPLQRLRINIDTMRLNDSVEQAVRAAMRKRGGQGGEGREGERGAGHPDRG